MSSRLKRAVAALVVLVLFSVGLSLAEGALRDTASQSGGLSANAQTMARAALEGTVDDFLARDGASVLSSLEGGAVPQWLAEVESRLPSPSQVLVNRDGKVVSLHWREGAGQAEELASALAAAGWCSVDSGVAGCSSYIRQGGSEEWLLVSEWKSGEGLVVLVQCA